MNKNAEIFLLMVLIQTGFSTCRKEEKTIPIIITAPIVMTNPVSAISSTAAIVGGEITDNGGAFSMVRGVCWNTKPNIIDTSSFFLDETVFDPGSFTIPISSLIPDTTYYVRAYACNEADLVYGDQISFTTNTNLSDIDGRTYGTVNIGSQVWMTSNLETTKYNDGETIPLVTDQSDWKSLTGPGYYYFSWRDPWFDLTFCVETLYNWYSVNSGKLCPLGWHIPSDAEWLLLALYVGPDILSSNKWSNYEQTNADAYLFHAYNAVIRDTINGIIGWDYFGNGRELTPRWWSSTSSSGNAAWYFVLEPEMMRQKYSKKYGLPVRCIKD